MNALWTTAGLALTALAIAGALLPVMPSTVFALGAAACFARSSPRLERWLLRHPWVGPPVHAWRAERAIPTAAKVLAVASMAASASALALSAPLAATAAALAVLVPSAVFVATRPAPSPAPATVRVTH